MEEEVLQKSVSTITIDEGIGALNLLFGFWILYSVELEENSHYIKSLLSKKWGDQCSWE